MSSPLKFKAISKTFPQKLFLKKSDDEPTLSLERNISVLDKQSDINKKIYKTFYDYLTTYLVKISSPNVKSMVDSLVSRNLIYIGRDINSPTKNGVVGTVVFVNGNLGGVVLDTVELDIDTYSGETDNIDSCIYASYFLYARAAVIYNKSYIIKNDELHNAAIDYLVMMYMRLIGANSYLTDKQKVFLRFVCSYFYRRFLVGIRHPKSVEDSISYVNSEYADECLNFKSRLEKYTRMKDIFKAMTDYMITQETPSMLMMKTLQKYNNMVFYCLNSTLDYLLGLITISKYPASFSQTANINAQCQQTVETIMIKYMKKIKYNVGSLDKL